MTEITQTQIETLMEAAREAQLRAYTPYSGYKVGAAIIDEDGRIFAGCNVENASYPASICAERVAITKAVSEGSRAFVAIVVVTDNAGSPCGICRQVMNEFGPEMRVIMADREAVHKDITVPDLLPYAFGPDKLP